MSAEAKPYNARFAGAVPHDLSYYSKCVMGGVLACGLTHAAITPLDVTKCNMQVSFSYSEI
jgi:solute carrier family 25 phosphate transporter 3